METQSYASIPDFDLERAKHERRLHLISQIFDQLRFLHGYRDDDDKTFDKLMEYDLAWLERKIENNDAKVKIKTDSRRDFKLRREAIIVKEVQYLKEQVKTFSNCGDDTVVDVLTKQRDELIEEWKAITGKYHFL